MSDAARRLALAFAAALLVAALAVAALTAPPLDPDRARSDQLLSRGPTELDAVLADAAGIVDPVLREAAVVEWVRRNRGTVDPALATRVCESLGGVAMDVCVRRVNSPHLQSKTAAKP